MLAALLRTEDPTAALVLALASAIGARAASGPGLLSPARIVRGPAEPVSRREPAITRKEGDVGAHR